MLQRPLRRTRLRPHHADSSPAAIDGYTYWGYYVWNPDKTQWDYMQVGANDPKQLPEDGDVYGFRWALVVQDPRVPRAEPTFDELCASAPAADEGEVQIGFVLDYGAEADAPDGDTPPEPAGMCVVADRGVTVQQALQSEVAVRSGDGGLICGIDGYPSQGCGETVKDAEEGPADQQVQLAMPTEDKTDSTASTSDAADATDNSDDGGVPWGLVIAGGVVVVLGAGALVLRSKRA